MKVLKRDLSDVLEKLERIDTTNNYLTTSRYSNEDIDYEHDRYMFRQTPEQALNEWAREPSQISDLADGMPIDEIKYIYFNTTYCSSGAFYGFETVDGKFYTCYDFNHLEPAKSKLDMLLKLHESGENEHFRQGLSVSE